MLENSIYYGKKDFYDIIRSLGGAWNDFKERPLLALIKLSEDSRVCWAIPMGNWEHRELSAQKRITKYLNFDKSDIRSCYYHLGKTDVKSIFFISDIIPISDEYIEREYKNKYTGCHHIIKNKPLIDELTRKAKRILAWENANPNFFRQHITDVKKYLLTT